MDDHATRSGEARARELGIPDTEAAQERAFGKVGLKKPNKGKRKK